VDLRLPYFFFRKDNNMKENVEVVVKVGLGTDEKLMSIMTSSRENVRYDTLDYGATGFYRLQIKNATIMYKEHREWNVEYGKEYYANREEELWVIERPRPIEFYIARTKNRDDIRSESVAFDKEDKEDE
jgi:hypothetical protein